MPGLLETTASIVISAALVATMSASMAAAARTRAALDGLAADLFRLRQLEHLVDRAVLAAGTGPGRPPPLASLDAENLVLAADTDGDGSVDPNSSETTAVEVREAGGDARVRVRLGRQTMTVFETPDAVATLEARDRDGHPADTATTTLVELAIASPDGSGAPSRRLSFFLPAATLP